MTPRAASPRRRRWPVFLAEAALFVGVFLAVHAWQTRDLVAAGAAPETRLVDLDGRLRTLDEFRGRPTLVYFFAPWCGVCAASADNLARLARWRAGGLDVVLVALDYGSPEEVADYRLRHGLTMPVLLGDRRTAERWRVRGYPTYYVLDAEGRVRARDFGYSTFPGLYLRSFRAGSSAPAAGEPSTG